MMKEKKMTKDTYERKIGDTDFTAYDLTRPPVLGQPLYIYAKK